VAKGCGAVTKLLHTVTHRRGRTTFATENLLSQTINGSISSSTKTLTFPMRRRIYEGPVRHSGALFWRTTEYVPVV